VIISGRPVGQEKEVKTILRPQQSLGEVENPCLARVDPNPPSMVGL
jgi:hypothetical protein